MKNTSAILSASIAFIAGGAAVHLVPAAFAQAAPLTAQIIDITALEGDAIGPIAPTTELRQRMLVMTDQATISVQQGNINKHFHGGNEEIQYILAGTGTIWLGDTQRPIKAGDLIVIPKGTVHAGTIATSGNFKALVVKMPPQKAGDVNFVQ